MGRLAVAVIVSSWIIPISILVNRIVPDPYMDEIFHVPQAQQYCKGNFGSWDPMITTPPGLYFLSLAHVACFFPGMFCIQAASSFSDVCSTVALRSTNAILAVICSILVYEIITQLRPALDEMKATLNAIVLALYPLHWFFTFLYYTDVASLTAVLAMYLACLKKNYLFSALLGLLAVFVRQTNIIWVLFVACSGVIECTLTPSQTNVRSDEPGLSVRKDSQLASDKGVTKGSNLRKRRHGLFDEIQRIFYMAWHLKWELLVSLSPFFMVLVAFVAFVSWNGSVVLGAKDAHAVTPHFAQIMYFSLVSALFMAPFHISVHQVAALLQSFWKDRLLSFFQLSAALIAGFLSVHFFSIAHPYLLADNRHYPFYLWRKVINAHWSMKYLLVPLYVYSWFSIFNLLAQAQKKIWVLSYFLASAAVLVPAPLIEFRYYTIPFFFLILHLHINDYRSWLLMGILYIVINIFTIYMFLFRPYSWDHEPGIQRFIW
ncbi:dol-P-Glc:Glc(2)Man(9)GlcNAc(2)-PP-Dol alpha-1,2-glucosyltransferase isoform X2 [Diospyros lotus]|uniref:dol-P-Glc:Glc(2)Man(9)GlcNAc(2)-PP-Dol alpha-1,2-glucosyltransferase isoform X2 n=1 Tax=Diospyros lotus TaxID=55363 RepID=UPI00225C28E6|nr:dol-P-Glc:Glc(2)Man(9)GlcNAc(2)-PP-Dol alpha-1,2-glucosyltransferase isoform X2 [Diospyros lotus]